MTKKIGVLLLILMLVIPSSVVFSACKLQIYDVIINPSVTLAKACYDVLFMTTCEINEGSYLIFHLPAGCELPYGCGSCGARIDQRNDRVSTDGIAVTFQLNSTLYAGRHKFRICDVTNPPTHGPHFISVSTDYGVFSSPPFNLDDTSVSTPEVEVTPDYVKACAEYEITFRTSSDNGTGCGCRKRTVITLEFPVGFEFPSHIDPDLVLVNGRAVDSITIRGNTLVLTPNESLDAGDKVRVEILSGAGIRNPDKPGWYRIKVDTSSDRIPAESEWFYIRPSTVTRADVIIEEPYTCSTTSIELRFQTGPYGEIEKGQTIGLMFPPEFGVIEEIPDGSISINNEPMVGVPSVAINAIDKWKRITLTSPTHIPAESSVTIVILPSAMITLPNTPGDEYQIDILTSSESVRVPSKPFKIERSRLRGVRLEMSPAFVGLPAEAKISFRLGGCGELKPGYDTITISFAEDFWFPDSTLFTDITVNGTPVDRIVMVEGHKVTLSPPEFIEGGSWVNIIFGKGCGIRNPSKAGKPQKVRVWTNRESDPSPSTVVVFATTKLTGVTMTPNEQMVGKWTGASITFVLGTAGALQAGSEIHVKFMGDFDFKGSISTRTVRINGEKPSRVRWDSPDLTVRTAVDIEAGQMVTVTIDEYASLRMPDEPGYYTVLVHTDAEPDPIPSAEFGVADPIVIVCSTDPVEPDGRDGWFTTQPILIVNAYNSLDPHPNIIYEINFDEYQYYAPIKLTDGFNVVTITAVDIFGNEATHKLSVEVDSHPPVFDPQSGQIYARSKVHREMVEVIDVNTVVLDIEESDSCKVEISRSGLVWVTAETDIEGDIVTAFTATDEAGNVAVWERTVTFDWTDPVLEIPDSFKTNTKTITLEGVTEPECQVTIEIGESKIIAEVSADGHFAPTIELEDGYNHIVVTSTDPAGNRTIDSLSVTARLSHEVTIRIGSKEATADGESVTLSHAPYLADGHTMIPLRFVSSSLGADIGYESATKTISVILGGTTVEMVIGNKTALVDGKPSQMPVAPEVLEGSSFVPLRFLCESLGMEIAVDGKVITISYSVE